MEELEHRPMLNKPAVTVVMPCYNAKAYIASAIQSVLAQNWPDIDIVVVDDGSTDGSAELVRNAFPSVNLIRQANQGVAVARNTGIAHAKGQWIAFLDADDIWLPGKLAMQFEALGFTPGARMAYSAWQVWPSNEPEPSTEFVDALMAKRADAKAWCGPSGWIYPALLLDCVVWTSTVLVHRSVIDEVGNFDTTLRIGEDYDLWLRMSRVTPIIRADGPMALYRIHPASITRTVPEMNFRNVVVTRAINRWGYASPDGKIADQAAVCRGLAKSWCDFAGAHFGAGQYKHAVQAGLYAIRADWRMPNGWKILVKSTVALIFGRLWPAVKARA